MAQPETATKPVRVRPPAIHVAVDDVHVRYQTPTDARSASAGQNRVERLTNRLMGRSPMATVRALAGVSLIAREGDAIGIVGLNGSGKSTLLRIIAGLERPARGRVMASAMPVLLGVNAAMVPEMSGRENVRLGCLAMGMTPTQARDAYQDIVQLSGIGQAIHHPMKTYSSGMGARLRFAIAAASKPQVLLIDEALATGDAAFKERSEERMNQLRAGAGCVFLVSHAAQTVEETCTRAIWLHKGRVVQDGEAVDVARAYRWYAWNLAKGKHGKAKELLEDAFQEGYDTVVTLLDSERQAATPRHARMR